MNRPQVVVLEWIEIIADILFVEIMRTNTWRTIKWCFGCGYKHIFLSLKVSNHPFNLNSGFSVQWIFSHARHWHSLCYGVLNRSAKINTILKASVYVFSYLFCSRRDLHIECNNDLYSNEICMASNLILQNCNRAFNVTHVNSLTWSTQSLSDGFSYECDGFFNMICTHLTSWIAT